MTEHVSKLIRTSTLVAVCLSIFLTAQTSLVAQLTTFDREAIKMVDSVRLRTGTRIRGQIIKEGKNEAGRPYTIIKTESQSSLKLDSRFVESTQVVNDDDKIYNNKITIMDDTPEHHWSAVEWCGKQSKGAIRYKDQIEFHLNRIMLLDSNDTKARRQLGYDYLQDQDRWVPKKLYWTSLGYRSKAGKAWVPTLQDQANQNAGQRNSNLGDRKQKFTAWKKKVDHGGHSKTQLANELFSFCDALAVPMVFKAAKEENNPEVRALYVEAFGKLSSSGAAQALVFFSVEDRFNRDRALDLLLQDHYNPSFVAGHLARYFDPNKYSNSTLQRAAFNVGEINDPNSVLPLIGVLSTKHVVAPADDPGRLTTGFRSDGRLNSFSTGGSNQPRTIVSQNKQVLGALGKISGEDFGFDPTSWRKWYVENHTATEVNVRGDFNQ